MLASVRQRWSFESSARSRCSTNGRLRRCRRREATGSARRAPAQREPRRLERQSDRGALGRTPPATAQKALQVYVSQLRKAVGRDRNPHARRPGTSSISRPVSSISNDSSLVADGRLAQALRLARFPACRVRLRALRPERDRTPRGAASGLSRAADQPRSRGRTPCSARRGARGARSRAPTARAAASSAHARALPVRSSGRGASDAYQAGRTLLSDELGLEPGADLKELQRAILEHDPALARATAASSPRADLPIGRRVDARRVAGDAEARGTEDRHRALLRRNGLSAPSSIPSRCAV